MKFVSTRPLADPEVAARKLVELANAVEPYFENRILIEKINGPFLYELWGSPEKILGRPSAGHREGLAEAARERDLCEVHAGRG
jgi:hypothetical protein